MRFLKYDLYLNLNHIYQKDYTQLQQYIFWHTGHIMMDLTWAHWGLLTSNAIIQVSQQMYYILTALLFPQVSGHVQASAKCWDTQTDAGAPQLQGPT